MNEAWKKKVLIGFSTLPWEAMMALKSVISWNIYYEIT